MGITGRNAGDIFLAPQTALSQLIYHGIGEHPALQAGTTGHLAR